MTITNPNAYTRDTMPWVHSTFIVSVSETSFNSYVDILKYTSADEQYGDGGVAGIEKTMGQVLNAAGSVDGPLPLFYSHRTCRDTSLGGNDAINPYYQYNEDDDVPNSFTKTDYGLGSMGRLYKETIQDNQQILYLTFGVPVFNDLSGFYKQAISASVANLMNQGPGVGAESLGRIAGNIVGTLVKLPVIPLLYINRLLGGLNRTPITKYYDFSNQMPLYYAIVQSLITSLAVNLGLGNQDGFVSGSSNPSQTNSPTQHAMTDDELYKQSVQQNGNNDGAGLPEVFRKYGFNIYKILLRKTLYENGNDMAGEMDALDVLTQQQSTPLINTDNTAGTWFDKMWNQFSGTLYDAQMFVGFRIEKSTDATETLSNQIGQSEVAQAINSQINSARGLSFSSMMGNISNGAAGQFAKTIIDGLGAFATGASEALGVDGLAQVMTGQGYVDIPDVWQNSTFTKSYNFNIALRAPMGDPVTIMESIYVPLCMLMAGAFPRAVGPSSYTSPFICRAYSRGLFAVPLGMIADMNIKRGGEQYGFNVMRLPLAVDVSFSIRDLSPTMYVAVGDGEGGILDQIFGANSSMQEYLMTLSGMGLADRILWYKNFRRKVEIFLTTRFAIKTHPGYWGMTMAETPIARMYSTILPSTKISND